MSIINNRSVYFKGFKILIIMIFILAAIDAISEQSRDKKTSADDADTLAMKQEWSEAMAALKTYSVNQRDQALTKADETLRAIDKRIEQLQNRAESEWHTLHKNVRKQREATMRNLNRERNQLAEWYGGMKHSSDEAWEDVKQGFIKAYGALSTSFGNARSEFNDDEINRDKKFDEDTDKKYRKNGDTTMVIKSHS